MYHAVFTSEYVADATLCFDTERLFPNGKIRRTRNSNKTPMLQNARTKRRRVRRESSSDDDDAVRLVTQQPATPSRSNATQASATSAACESPFAFTAIKQTDARRADASRVSETSPSVHATRTYQAAKASPPSSVYVAPSTPQKQRTLETRSRSFPVTPERLRMIAASTSRTGTAAESSAETSSNRNRSAQAQVTLNTSTMTLTREERLRLSRLKQEEFRRRQRQRAADDSTLTLQKPVETPAKDEHCAAQHEQAVDQSLSLGD